MAQTKDKISLNKYEKFRVPFYVAEVEKVVSKIKLEVTKVSYQQTTEVGMKLPNVARTSLYISINNSAANQDIFMKFSHM